MEYGDMYYHCGAQYKQLFQDTISTKKHIKFPEIYFIKFDGNLGYCLTYIKI